MRARIAVGVVGALLAAFLGFVGYARYGLTLVSAIAGSSAPVAPAGQRPFEILTDANFSDLREVFNAHAAEPRIVALLSASGLSCVRGASALDTLLQHQRDKKVAVLIVWERVGRSRFAPAATRPPPSRVLSRISDVRAAQFWDGGQLTSSALRDAVRKHPEWPSGELRNAGVIWDRVLVFAPGGVGMTRRPCRATSGATW